MTIARIVAGRDVNAVISTSPDMPVHGVIALMAEHRIGALPIMEAGRVAGIFSERDVLYCLAKEGAAALQRPVRDVMTAPAITVSRDTSVLAALSLMTQRRIRHLPVIDGQDFVGFVSIGDLVKHRIDAIEKEAEAMRSYIQAV